MGMCASSWDDEAIGFTFHGTNAPGFPHTKCGYVWSLWFGAIQSKLFEERLNTPSDDDPTL